MKTQNGYPRRITDMNTLKDAILSAPIGEISNTLRRMAFDLRDRGCTRAIMTLGRSGQWEKALEFYEAMCEEYMRAKGVTPNAFTFSALISVCCNSRQCGKALELFQKMKTVEISGKMLRETYGTIIAACEREKLYQDVFKLYEEMTMSNVAPDRMTCACVLDVSVICKRWELAAEVIQLFPPNNLQTYIQVIRGLAGQRECILAVDVFNAMRLVPVVPNPEVCHALVRAMECSREVDMALEFFREMRGAGIQTSAKSYNSLLRLLSKTGKWDEMVRVQMNMDSLGMEVDVTTCKTILERCTLGGENELASNLQKKFDYMKERREKSTTTSQISSSSIPAHYSYSHIRTPSIGSYYCGSPTWAPIPINPYYRFCMSPPGSDCSSIMTPRYL